MSTPRNTIARSLERSAARLGLHGAELGLLDSSIAISALLAAARRQHRSRVPESGRGVDATGKRLHSRQTRTWTTILFGDIVGFTSLAERIDPEYVGEMINSLWSGLDRLVLEFGGVIDKHIGDALMATWGVFGAREDDSRQAVLCGLRMQEWLSDYTSRFRFTNGRTLDAPLAMRIGIHAGLALFGPIGTIGELTVLGDAVNTAARIQASADSGTVLVSDSVFKASSGTFNYAKAAAINVKGKSEPVAVYQVLRLKEAAARTDGRGIEGVHVAMQGREAELAFLTDFRSAAMHRLQLGLVVGEAGIGKSRLLKEFLDQLELSSEQIPLFIARCTPSGMQESCGVLRSLICTRLELPENPGDLSFASSFRVAFGAALERYGTAAAQAEKSAGMVAEFLGVSPADQSVLPSDPRSLALHSIEAIRWFFLSYKPLVPCILVEDIHWADQRSLDSLLQMFSADTPICLLCTARPSLEEHSPGFFARFERAGGRLLRLQALDYRQTLELARSIFSGFPELPDRIEQMVRLKAEGNPYFIEELFRMLVDRGVVNRATVPWTLDTERLDSLDVPDTLNGILRSRIDGLDPRSRLALQGAAVIGRQFWDGAVKSILKGTCRLRPSQFQALNARELVFPRPSSSFAGLREYFFKHALLRDVAYGAILKRERPRYHEYAARWLERQCGENPEAYAAMIAGHFEHAERYAEASHWYELAARRAEKTWDNEQAVLLCYKAELLLKKADLKSDGDALFRIKTARERLLDRMGNRDRQKREIAELYDLVNSLDGSESALYYHCLVMLRDSSLHELLGEYDRAFALATEATTRIEAAAGGVDIQSRQGSEPKAREAWVRNALAEAAYLRGRSLWRKGQISAALPFLEEACLLAQSLGESKLLAEALRNVGAAVFHQGDVELAMARTQESLDIARRIGDESAEGSALNNLGDENRFIGNYGEAERHFSEALVLQKRSGERWAMAFTHLNLALVQFRRGDRAGALANTQAAAAISAAIELRSIVYASALLHGHLLLADGDVGGAEAQYQNALDLALNLGNSVQLAEARANLAFLQTIGENNVTALDLLEPSMAVYLEARLDGIDEPFFALERVVTTLQLAGDPRGEPVLAAAARRLADTLSGLVSAYYRERLLLTVRVMAPVIAGRVDSTGLKFDS